MQGVVLALLSMKGTYSQRAYSILDKQLFPPVLVTFEVDSNAFYEIKIGDLLRIRQNGQLLTVQSSAPFTYF